MEESRYGLQKLTLLDYPGRTACTVFTCGCNFRCPFCHNASLVRGANREMALSRREILDFLRFRYGILDGVAITGGEPLLRMDTVDLLAEIKKIGYSVKLDTNGSFPERLQEIVERKLVDMVAVDIKNSPAKYEKTCGSPFALDKVRETVKFLQSGVVPFEFRTTVVSGFHEPEDFEEIGRWIAGDEAYFLQSFKDSGDVLALSDEMAPVRDEVLAEMLKTVRKYVPKAAVRGR